MEGSPLPAALALASAFEQAKPRDYVQCNIVARHREERSDAAIQLDCFAALAMTELGGLHIATDSNSAPS
jgi:hypothetical protein